MSASKSLTATQSSATSNSAILLSTGLAFASIILVPAFAARLGVGMALTGAMRIALMRASSRMVNGSASGEETEPAGFSCH